MDIPSSLAMFLRLLAVIWDFDFLDVSRTILDRFPLFVLFKHWWVFPLPTSLKHLVQIGTTFGGGDFGLGLVGGIPMGFTWLLANCW